ncbi:hypothetical protein Q9Q94_16300 [Uliginosibacterium sp. 31-16]|uniref:hypothetical protein n=1 Tax=Uliginosibacterium sp. 31-16 TaxID=3068315 RepID=UPI00273EBBE2|nr:hypothetical protein [Uliginosibacterium sp. 31-16]MDP5241104.1 hypothetical protein [Uliginosibacterium sp. 31-16]
MRKTALFVGLLATACLCSGGWLLWATHRFFNGADYAPHVVTMLSYEAGAVEADGSGIFLPAALLLGIGLVLGRFAVKLWRNKAE